MSTIENSSTVTLTAAALEAVREIVGMQIDDLNVDPFVWDGVVAALDKTRHWAAIADDLATDEVPASTAAELVPLVERFLDDERQAITGTRWSRDRRIAGNTDHGWGGTLEEDLAGHDREIAYLAEKASAYEEFIGAATRVCS